MTNDRAITYIDGFNLYYGLMQGRLGTSRWLDLERLSESLLLPTQELVLTRYFTARIRGNPPKEQRQSDFIDALNSKTKLEIDFGHFLTKTVACRQCRSTWPKHEEKKTDVNIATPLKAPSHQGRFGQYAKYFQLSERIYEGVRCSHALGQSNF